MYANCGPCQPVYVAAPAAPRRRSYSRRRRLPYKVKRKLKAYRSQRRSAYKYRQLIQAEMPRGSEASKAFWGVDYASATPASKLLRKAMNFRGKGDYGGDAGGNQIIGGSIQKPMTVNQDPSNLSGDVVLSHREFLQNVTATGGLGNISPFSVVSFPVNVGITTTFPWLSQIAQNFTLYELEGLIFEFRPTSGELGATGSNSLGKVVMCTQYDPDAADFTTSVAMENYDYSNSCKPSEHMLHGVETERGQRMTNMLYIRTGTSTKDKVQTDYGTFQIATEGLPLTNGTRANIGELWVSYKVRLSRAQLFGSLIANDVKQDNLLGYSNTRMFDKTTASLPLEPFYTLYNIPTDINSASSRKTNTIGCIMSSSGLNAIAFTFPKNIVTGYFHIKIWVRFATPTTNGFNNTTSASNGTLELPKGIAIANTIPASTQVFTTQANLLLACEAYFRVNAPGNLQASFVLNLTANVPVDTVTSACITELPLILGD